MILKKSEQMILSIASLNLSTSVMKKLHKFSFFVCIFVFFSCAASNLQKGERVVLNKMITGKYFLSKKEYQKSKENFLFVAQEINRVWNCTKKAEKLIEKLTKSCESNTCPFYSDLVYSGAVLVSS